MIPLSAALPARPKWIWLGALICACAGAPAPSPSVAPSEPTETPAPFVANEPVPGLNDELRAVLERYRVAFKRGDLETLLSLASDDYSDDAGTPSPVDDVTRAQLPDMLASRAQVVLNDVSLRYVAVQREGDQVSVRVELDVEFELSGRVHQRSDEALLVLRAEPDGYRFLSGM